MESNKHWAEQLKKDDKVIAFIRHFIDGSKNRSSVELKVIINLNEFGCYSIIGIDDEDITYRVPYNELTNVN